MDRIELDVNTRIYSAALILAELHKLGHRLESVSVHTGIPHATLRRWITGSGRR